MLKSLNKNLQEIQQIGSTLETRDAAENYTNLAAINDKIVKVG